MIRLRGVTKRYGSFEAVHGIDLDIEPGELFGLLGPNGAGKTTTMRMIAGILAPTGGTIEVGGEDILRHPMRAKAKLGFIPDRPFVYDKLTGAEFLRFTAALFGQDGAELEGRIDELLDLFDLGPWKHELTESYSHGMRQKLIIASALVHRPEVIVVDEPMIGLDPKSAKLLKTLFRRYTDLGGTVLMSTHTMEIVEGLCDRVGIISKGNLVACGTVEELRRDAAADGAGMEELFLRLTGEHVDHDLDALLS